MDRHRSPTDGEPPWEALEALAAGELPADEARALRERLAVEPGWQETWQRIESVEGLLRSEPLLALPLSLVPNTLARILPLERVRPWHAVARAAAAILVFCFSWFAFSGQAPALASVEPRSEMTAGLRVPAFLPDVPAAPAIDATGGAAVLVTSAGLALVFAGAFLGLRWHRRAEAAA